MHPCSIMWNVIYTRMGLLKASFINFSFQDIFGPVKIILITGAIAAQLQWDLSNMNMIFKRQQISNWFWKARKIMEQKTLA